ncbi:hypothetical protein AXG93_1040s1320 [Marchantia polymorpha subsp. ruderalis]|uniref:Uncharacterized protein n=1 Tax=Marchantia polymorpha subsp. ruderalis TaxID=1480154 RepID=A0A176VET7_MARPO|nr:hypothetical protein AXG93_1040s1320 [Marchantia polymorpha subsp. ruderalis]
MVSGVRGRWRTTAERHVAGKEEEENVVNPSTLSTRVVHVRKLVGGGTGQVDVRISGARALIKAWCTPPNPADAIGATRARTQSFGPPQRSKLTILHSGALAIGLRRLGARTAGPGAAQRHEMAERVLWSSALGPAGGEFRSPIRHTGMVKWSPSPAVHPFAVDPSRVDGFDGQQRASNGWLGTIAGHLTWLSSRAQLTKGPHLIVDDDDDGGGGGAQHPRAWLSSPPLPFHGCSR